MQSQISSVPSYETAFKNNKATSQDCKGLDERQH